MGLGLARRRPPAALAALLALTTAAGCATYTDRLRATNQAVAVGDYEAAQEQMDKVLGVSSTDQLPNSWGGDRPLAALERGSLQQAVRRYDGSARDLSAAEQELELLDLGGDTLGTLGSYLYSDSATLYALTPADHPGPPATQFAYLADGEVFAGEPGRDVSFTIGSIDIEWNWSDEEQRYERSQEGSAHVDKTYGRVGADNVILLGVDYRPSSIDANAPEAITIGGTTATCNGIHGNSVALADIEDPAMFQEGVPVCRFAT